MEKKFNATLLGNFCQPPAIYQVNFQLWWPISYIENLLLNVFDFVSNSSLASTYSLENSCNVNAHRHALQEYTGCICGCSKSSKFLRVINFYQLHFPICYGQSWKLTQHLAEWSECSLRSNKLCRIVSPLVLIGLCVVIPVFNSQTYLFRETNITLLQRSTNLTWWQPEL